MKAKILSMGQLLEKGYDIHMKDKCLYLRDDRGSLIARVPMSSNKMFLMNIHHDAPKCLKAYFDNQSWLWHLRLGHFNFGGLKLLSTKNMVKGLPSIDQPDELCEACLIGKQHRHSFLKESISRAKARLELIHIDVCGPIDPASLEVFSTFKRFKALMEKHSGYQIKAIRSDRGGEFISKEFMASYEENDICGPLTIPYSPQQNVVVERKNQSIVNMTRSMLKSKNSPKKIGAEAVDCAVQESKGYKLYNHIDKKMKVSRDVTFDEKNLWDWTDRDKEQYVFYPIDTDRKEVEEEPIEPVTPSSPMFDDFKKEMAKEFEMSDIGLMSYYLGIEVKQIDDGIFISQEAYAKEVLKRFNMENCNPISIPIEVEKKMSRHAKEGLIDQTLFRSCRDTSEKDQSIRPCSEAWLIYVDNKSAITLAKNPVFHDRSKHIDTRYHFIRESIAKKQVQVKFVKSEDQVANIFTKPLNREVFEKLQSRLRMRESSLGGRVEKIDFQPISADFAADIDPFINGRNSTIPFHSLRTLTH
ncbi:hypothetical protein RJ640_012248 [Escallonia rubra]|uniref:Integrase catalytic domain-containing protein n=1 Tax=Escallonia rubra TaxID=112253 RepID=A0AA88RLS6_9ASTE|nr:hypothetical protein RJ640_012248 [Escallonia rubra]